MANDAWIEFDGVEFVNLSRTAYLAQTLGLDTVWTQPEDVAWVEDALGGADYDLIDTAPWYDPTIPASAEFAGIVPLSITGLDDSTRESSTNEYVTDGGRSGRARNRTLVMVASVAIVASTERGADFGKRWMDRVLSGNTSNSFCAGATLRYFRFRPEAGQPAPPVVHRNDVAVTRGSSVTRKRHTHCSATWLVTFTWTAGDPFEYGEEMARLVALGTIGVGAPGGGSLTHGSLAFEEAECPDYDYTPLYDPVHPALVPSPTAPDFYPDGWALVPGLAMTRYWAELETDDIADAQRLVPVVTLTATAEARYVRVSVWDTSLPPEDSFCDPLWTAIISYLPSGLDFVIDGEQQVAYAWDGLSPIVRRADSLVYDDGARPLDWTAFSHVNGLLVTLDVPDDSAAAAVQVALSLVTKSD